MKSNFACTSILRDEIWIAMIKRKPGKAIGPDNISVQLFEALIDFRIDEIATLFI